MLGDAEHKMDSVYLGYEANGVKIPPAALSKSGDAIRAKAAQYGMEVTPDGRFIFKAKEAPKPAEPVAAQPAGRTVEAIRQDLADNQKIIDDTSTKMMDAKGARYAKLDALFEKHSDIRSNFD